jgi:hypothetical protein
MLQPLIYVPASLLDGLVAYWKLDETSGTRIDSAGSSNLADNNIVGSTTGKIGNAANFNGTNYLSTTSTWAPSNSFTISAWIKLNSALKRTIVGQDWADTPPEIRNFLFRIDNGTLEFFILSGGATSVNLSSVALNDGNWHFVAAIYDDTASTIKIWADTNTNTAGSVPTPSFQATTIYVGRRQFLIAPDNFIGDIDEVGIWNRALTAAEISILYNSGAGITFPF